MSSKEKTHTRLVLWAFFLSAAECAGFHSLGFLSTGRFPPGTGPDFEQVTVFDGVLISHCDSRTPQEQFKAVLESHNLIRTCEEAQYDVSDALREVSKFINGPLYVQRRRGCTRSAEGLTSAFEIWAVNGEDFIQFDADHQEWEALADTAVTIRDSWNNQEIRNIVSRSFLKEQCPQMIQRIKLREVEQRTDLRVFATPIDGFRTLLKCHVTSTDKSLRSLSLTEDGASRALWVAVRGPLPSVDGSVVLRLTAKVPLESSNIYGCVVPTGGGPITVMWDGKTLDGRDIFYASIYWISLYILGSLVFLIALLAWPIQRWYLRSRRERRRLHFKNVVETLSSLNSLIQDLYTYRVRQNEEIKSLIQRLYTLRDLQNEKINSLIQGLYRDPQNVEMESLMQRLYTHRVHQNEEIESLMQRLYTHRDRQNVEMESLMQRLYTHRGRQSVEIESLIQDLDTHRDPQNVEMKSLIRDLDTHRDLQNVEMKSLIRDLDTHRDPQNVEMKSLIRDLDTHRDCQNEEMKSLIRDLDTHRDRQNKEIKSLKQRLYTHRDRQNVEMESLIQGLYKHRDSQNVEMESFSPDSHTFTDFQTDRKSPSCGSSLADQTEPQLHLGVLRNSV